MEQKFPICNLLGLFGSLNNGAPSYAQSDLKEVVQIFSLGGAQLETCFSYIMLPTGHDAWLKKVRQACSSQIQYLSKSTKITTNIETAMLSTFAIPAL